jgi:hypothetical protein
MNLVSRLRDHLLGPKKPADEPEPAEEADSGMMVAVDYPLHPRPRWGYEVPLPGRIIEVLERGRERYEEILRAFRGHIPAFLAIPRLPKQAEPETPSWINEFLSALDSIALYHLLAEHRPATYLEIGSGESTKFARRAIEDRRLPTRVLSLDPEPRSGIDRLCDQVIRQPLEDIDLALFAELRSGDMVFYDGSHRVFTNSDVTVMFLEVLPALPPGVLVQIHDIYLPWDYPPDWNERYYSEQYLLAMALLAGGDFFEVVLPNTFVTRDPELSELLDPLWELPVFAGAELHGESFWIRTRAR